jgi:hypothetical protein
MMKLQPLCFRYHRYGLLWGLLFFCNWAYAQQPSRLSLSFSPLALIDDVSFPTVLVGAEYRISKRVAVFTDLGIKYRKSMFESSGDSAFLASRGFKWKGEVRLSGIAPMLGWSADWLAGIYAGFNVFYNRDVYNTEISYYAMPDTVNQKRDAFGMRKSVPGFNFLLGQRISLKSNRVWLDVYVGAGGRVRLYNSVDKEFNPDVDEYTDNSMDVTIEGIRDKADAKEGPPALPHITAGIRLCIAL